MLQQYSIVAIQPAIITIRLATSQVIEVPFTKYMNVDGANQCDKCGREHNRFLDDEVISCNCDGTSTRYFPTEKVEQYVGTVVAPSRPTQDTAPQVNYVGPRECALETRQEPPLSQNYYVSSWPSRYNVNDYTNLNFDTSETTTTESSAW